MQKTYIKIKRIIDLILAITLLIILSPLMILIGILIKIDSKGPVFFKQERTGKDNQKFMMYKFRSMTPENNVMDFKSKDKITKIGKILRKTSIDELPQLINVIKGEMSFVGPRPWIPEYSKYFSKNQRHRLDVLPGITGLAQCKGRNGLTIIEKIKYDLEYVNNISLKLDLYIILKTPIMLFITKGEITSKETIYKEIEILKNQSNKNSPKKYNKKILNNKPNFDNKISHRINKIENSEQVFI